MPVEQWLAQQAQQTANSAMGLFLGDINDKRQRKQQKRLQDIQIEGQKEMGEYNYQQQMRMWRDTNYKAQMEQMKMAGLNPGLLYGMGGGGGTTVGHQGGTVSGGTAAGQTGEAIAMTGMGMQRELLQAQKENIVAQTEKTKAETSNLPLTGENIKADTAGKYLNNEFMKKSMEDRIDIINSDRALKIEELNRSIGDSETERSTRIKRIEEINMGAATAMIQQKLADQLRKESAAKTGNLGKQNQLIDSEMAMITQKIKESDELIKYWANVMIQKWAQMDRDGAAAAEDEPELFEKLLDKIPGFIIGRGRGGGQTTPVRGFHQR